MDCLRAVGGEHGEVCPKIKELGQRSKAHEPSTHWSMGIALMVHRNWSSCPLELVIWLLQGLLVGPLFIDMGYWSFIH